MSNNKKILPKNIYTPWGWSKDLVDIIWPYNIKYINNNIIDNYLKIVQKDINYQCVIFALFDKNKLLVIDCCDASDWEVPINEEHLYIKLQYNPNYQYKNNTTPFIYLPSNPNYYFNNLQLLQNQYLNSNHDLNIYGRWIAVSLERYNMAKEMRKLGISWGGQYCLVPKGSGYDDQEENGLLDPYKPRERISFIDYCSWINRSMSVLDCRGFGEFTHRMIECFGMKVPLIRPKMTNQTLDPLQDGKHYIDCGTNGNNLQKAIDIIETKHLREDIIGNAYEWYINNLTMSAIQAKVDYFIDQLYL